MADDRLITSAISDESARAYNAMLDRLEEIDLSCLLVYMIDVVPAAALPYLAEQFHVMGIEGWSFADTDAARRTLIKSAIDLHRYKGTEYGIKRALEIVGLTYTLQKWWEYGGAPYHFRASIDVMDSGVTEEQAALFAALLNGYKALRDHLDTLQFNLATTGCIYVGVSLQSSDILTVYPGSPMVMLIDETTGAQIVDEDTGAPIYVDRELFSSPESHHPLFR